MTHPDDLLADYVDGTLTDEDRAAVDAHLSSCARCRAEVDVASRAARALASLAEPPAPAGLADAAIAEARAPRLARAAAPRWYRAAAVVAAAAAIVLVALTLPHIGTSSDRSSAASASVRPAMAVGGSTSEGGASTAGAATILHQGRNYDAAALQDLAGAAASDAAAPTGAPGTSEETTTALRCLIAAGVPTDQQLRTLIAAAFRGTPADIAVIAEAPEAGQPTDRITVWAVDSSTCQLLSFAQRST
jgi:anti-sigma factor RsiW